ncbi:MAG TPA: MarR family transcriptional regulator [Bryobacteraceae bacterium]|nr:MarR family transcriptional regulator [Bryobacteraceae bacterium]
MSKPEPSAGTGPAGRIRRAHLSMQRCCDAVFAPRKITTDQYSLLRTVERRQGIRQNELAVELFTDPNTVTAMLVRLEKRGLVRRETCPEDGRARRVSLTPAGRRLYARLSEDWEPMRRKLREIFAGEGGQEAFRILEEVRALMTNTREEILESRKRPAMTRRAAARTEAGAPVQASL